MNISNDPFSVYSTRGQGEDNTAIGAGALGSDSTGNGFGNTAIGADALGSNTECSVNTAIGSNVLSHITNGGENIALGEARPEDRYLGAGSALTGDSSDNIDIGNVGVAGEQRKIRIGTKNRHTATFVAGIRGVTLFDAIPVRINDQGKLGTQTSSRRFKKEIKAMDNASETILALKPVTFHFKSDSKGTPQFGLIAEEVAEVNPDLVVRDKNGEIYTVRYDAVNAMLLNEFLKEHKAFLEEHRKVERLEATVSWQQKQIEALAAGLEKVSNQVELGKPGPRTVANNQ
jgi:hypothetical protein